MPKSRFELIETRPGGILTLRVLDHREDFRAFLEKMKAREKEGKAKPVECIIQDVRHVRSTEISTHFHAHVSQVATDTGLHRDQVYVEALLLACEMEPPPGGAPYPFIIAQQQVKMILPGGTELVMPMDAMVPLRTSGRTNSEMLTAVEAIHRYAITRCDPVVCLRETPELWSKYAEKD